MTAFGELLREFRQSAPNGALSQNALARKAGLDPAYVNRLELGTQAAPSREAVAALADALWLGPAQTDEFLVAAGFWPWAGCDVALTGMLLTVGRAMVDRSMVREVA